MWTKERPFESRVSGFTAIQIREEKAVVESVNEDEFSLSPIWRS